VRESFWNVWVTLFSGLNTTPQSVAGRLVMSGVLVVGVALAGLFTASVASILIERSLRSRDVSNLASCGQRSSTFRKSAR
jgi:voltage-gated potassium channel